MTFDQQFGFRALGTPVPQGSIAYKGMRKGKPILTSDNPFLSKWRRIVASAAQEALPPDWSPLDEPVAVWTSFWLPSPQRRTWSVPAVKPDLDKLVRAVLDSLADAGVLLNDSRVVDLGGPVKLYADADNPPGVAVVVEWGNWG